MLGSAIRAKRKFLAWAWAILATGAVYAVLIQFKDRGEIGWFEVLAGSAPSAIALEIFLSVLYWLSAHTDHMAAGIQPTREICRIKQTMPAKGRPMVKNRGKDWRARQDSNLQPRD